MRQIPDNGARRGADAVKRRRRRAATHRWVRFGVQVLFFVMAPSLFSGAFGGLKYLCTQIGQGDVIESTAFVLQLVSVLAFTVVFGRFFCGYACAFGMVGDWLFGVFEFVRAKLGIVRPMLPERLVRILSLVKYVVLALICSACFTGAWPSVSGHSPWAAFASLLAGSFDQLDAVGVALLAGIVVLMVLRQRAFCQFLCPLGAVFTLMPVLPFSQLVRMRNHCAGRCGRCREACPMDIWPDANAMEHAECILCGRCADVCPMANVNMIALKKKARDIPGDTRAKKEDSTPRPLKKEKRAWRLLRGTEVGYVLLRAALLLAACWAVGALRYVSAPPIAF